MSYRVMPGGKQHITSPASPTHDLFIAALTDCSEKFLLGSEIEWSHRFKSYHILLTFRARKSCYAWYFLKECSTQCSWHSWASCITLVSTMNTRNGLSLYLIKSHVKNYGFNSSSLAHTLKNLR